ncbi:MAG: hypothetical protein ACJAWZ_001678, partial [Paracoccaceae bacterium]
DGAAALGVALFSTPLLLKGPELLELFDIDLPRN